METYLVGGAVRDKLLGYPYRESDWVVVGATAEQLLSQGYQSVGKDFPVFLHPDTKEEYALARTERKTAPGYTGFACFASPDVTLEQDLQRRDLSINAMAEDNNGNIIDPYGGQQDLENKILRHVSPAFIEDPLRVLRVARFSARYSHLGFQVADNTITLMRTIATSGELESLPAERIWKELQRSLTETSPQQFFTVLKQSEALPVLLPEFCELAASTIAALKTAVEQHASPLICFALLFININKLCAEQCCQRIKAPKAFRELSLLVSDYASYCAKESINAEQLLSLLERLDAFRRPKRFDDFLSCCELLFPHSSARQQLQEALAICATINVGELAEKGISGKEISIALRRQRLRVINDKQ
ncbi:MAG: multifunctional CCA tRNA nucleotidyl transferase/2'3'-cyclic phosphodiesterase/2'nucleotidase/phosphatase [Pseudomonadales bacterium]